MKNPSANSRYRAPIDFISVSPGSEDLLGIPPSWEGVKQRLATYSLAEVLDLLGRISMLLDKEDESGDSEIQYAILEGLFGRRSPVFMRLAQFENDIAKDGRHHQIVPFHAALVGNAVKAAVLAISPSAATPEPREDHRRLGQALLIINSLTSEGAIPLDHVTTEAGENALELFMVANGVFNAGSSGIHEFARAAELYLRDRPSLKGLACYRNLSRDIQDLTGLSVEKLWIAFFAIYANLSARSPEEMSFRGARLPANLLPGLLPGFSPEEVSQLLRLISQDEHELRSAIGNRYTWTNMKPLDFVPLARRPLVRIGDDYFLLGLRFLKEKLTTGLHHLFLDPETGLKPSQQRQSYLTYMGFVWENYVSETLERAYASRGDATIVPEALIKQRLKGKSVDALIVLGDLALVVESKATLLTIDVRSGENLEGYLGKLQDMVFDAAEQLDATVNAVENGVFSDIGVEGVRIRRYLPVIASLEPAIMNPLLVSRINTRMKAEGWLQNSKTAPLQVLDPSEIELLEIGADSGAAMELFLEQKTKDSNLAGVSFRNYLISRGRPVLDSNSSFLSERFKDLTGTALAYVRQHSETEPRDNRAQSTAPQTSGTDNSDSF